jgi:AcrR family transcriptional regulator
MSASGSRRRSRRDERKEETRAELIAAAAHVFARRGFHGSSLEEIARQAGYTTGAIYWHFTSKEDLFLAVYETYTTTRVREWEEIKRGVDAGDLPATRAWADQWMRRLHDDPEFLILAVEFLVHAWRNPPLRDAFANRVAAGRLALARILEDEAARGAFELPMAAEDLATVLRELGSGLGLAKLIDPDGIPDSLFGDFTDAFFDLVRIARRNEQARTEQRPRRPRPRRGTQ